MLIQYTLDYLQQYGKNNVVLLTDDEEIINKYKNEYKIIIDYATDKKDVLYAINECIKNELKCDYAFYLCVTNPFRENELLFKMQEKCLELLSKGQTPPLITTKTIVPNRKIFLIDENNKFKY